MINRSLNYDHKHEANLQKSKNQKIKEKIKGSDSLKSRGHEIKGSDSLNQGVRLVEIMILQ